jgi:hypothetical protein
LQTFEPPCKRTVSGLHGPERTMTSSVVQQRVAETMTEVNHDVERVRYLFRNMQL